MENQTSLESSLELVKHDEPCNFLLYIDDIDKEKYVVRLPSDDERIEIMSFLLDIDNPWTGIMDKDFLIVRTDTFSSCNIGEEYEILKKGKIYELDDYISLDRKELFLDMLEQFEEHMGYGLSFESVIEEYLNLSRAFRLLFPDHRKVGKIDNFTKVSKELIKDDLCRFNFMKKNQKAN